MSMTFATLKSRVAAILGRSPNDVVYEMVTADINTELRLKTMESTTTLVEATGNIALPADFLEVVDIYRDVDPRTSLRPATTQSINRTSVSSGTPSVYAIVDGFLILNPQPNASVNMPLRYIASLADLSADSDTNDVMTTYPSIYVYGAMAHHAALVGDERIALWKGAYESAKVAAQTASIKSRASGGAMVPVAGHATP